MENKKLRVYLSGPISYFQNENRMDECVKIFQRAKKDLEAFGYEVVNPFDNGLSHDAPWIRHIIKDLELLDTCDMICYLHTWDLHYSAGSQIEKIAARKNRLIEIRQTKNDTGYHYHRLEA